MAQCMLLFSLTFSTLLLFYFELFALYRLGFLGVFFWIHLEWFGGRGRFLLLIWRVHEAINIGCRSVHTFTCIVLSLLKLVPHDDMNIINIILLVFNIFYVFIFLQLRTTFLIQSFSINLALNWVSETIWRAYVFFFGKEEILINILIKLGVHRNNIHWFLRRFRLGCHTFYIWRFDNFFKSLYIIILILLF